MQKHPVVAVDTNFPLLLAGEDHEALDALTVLQERVRPSKICTTPTVMGELVYQTQFDPDERLRRLATKALNRIRSRTDLRATELDSTQEAIVEAAARRILLAGLLPPEECNDATILAESAVLNAILLVSNDSHLLNVDHRGLGLLFRELDLPVPLIVSPREIARKFYR